MTSRALRPAQERPLLAKSFVDEHKRERCAVALAEVVHEVGPHQLTTKLITKQAKIARTTFYELFGGRDVAAEWACTFALRGLLEPVQAAIDEGASVGERVEGGIGALVEAAAARPRLAELCLLHSSALFPGRAQPHGQALVEALRPVLDDAHPRSSGAAGSASFGELWAYGVLSVVAQRLREERFDSLSAAGRELTEIALAPCHQPSR